MKNILILTENNFKDHHGRELFNINLMNNILLIRVTDEDTNILSIVEKNIGTNIKLLCFRERQNKTYRPDFDYTSNENIYYLHKCENIRCGKDNYPLIFIKIYNHSEKKNKIYL